MRRAEILGDVERLKVWFVPRAYYVPCSPVQTVLSLPASRLVSKGISRMPDAVRGKAVCLLIHRHSSRR